MRTCGRGVGIVCSLWHLAQSCMLLACSSILLCIVHVDHSDDIMTWRPDPTKAFLSIEHGFTGSSVDLDTPASAVLDFAASPMFAGMLCTTCWMLLLAAMSCLACMLQNPLIVYCMQIISGCAQGRACMTYNSK